MKKILKVKLKTFFKTKESSSYVDEAENYWKLIGEEGIVIDKK